MRRVSFLLGNDEVKNNCWLHLSASNVHVGVLSLTIIFKQAAG